eukprot:g5031.t1
MLGKEAEPIPEVKYSLNFDGQKAKKFTGERHSEIGSSSSFSAAAQCRTEWGLELELSFQYPYAKGGILADKVGYGKTPVAIGLLMYKRTDVVYSSNKDLEEVNRLPPKENEHEIILPDEASRSSAKRRMLVPGGGFQAGGSSAPDLPAGANENAIRNNSSLVPDRSVVFNADSIDLTGGSSSRASNKRAAATASNYSTAVHSARGRGGTAGQGQPAASSSSSRRMLALGKNLLEPGGAARPGHRLPKLGDLHYGKLSGVWNAVRAQVPDYDRPRGFVSRATVVHVGSKALANQWASEILKFTGIRGQGVTSSPLRVKKILSVGELKRETLFSLMVQYDVVLVTNDVLKHKQYAKRCRELAHAGRKDMHFSPKGDVVLMEEGEAAAVGGGRQKKKKKAGRGPGGNKNANNSINPDEPPKCVCARLQAEATIAALVDKMTTAARADGKKPKDDQANKDRMRTAMKKAQTAGQPRGGGKSDKVTKKTVKNENASSSDAALQAILEEERRLLRQEFGGETNDDLIELHSDSDSDSSHDSDDDNGDEDYRFRPADCLLPAASRATSIAGTTAATTTAKQASTSKKNEKPPTSKRTAPPPPTFDDDEQHAAERLRHPLPDELERVRRMNFHFPVFELLIFARKIVDEVHEVVADKSEKEFGSFHTFRYWRALRTWGISGTPDIFSMRGVDDMSTMLFQLDLFTAKQPTLQFGERSPSFFRSLKRCEAWINTCARQNTKNSYVDAIQVVEHEVTVTLTAAERALYLQAERNARRADGGHQELVSGSAYEHEFANIHLRGELLKIASCFNLDDPESYTSARQKFRNLYEKDQKELLTAEKDFESGVLLFLFLHELSTECVEKALAELRGLQMAGSNEAARELASRSFGATYGPRLASAPDFQRVSEEILCELSDATEPVAAVVDILSKLDPECASLKGTMNKRTEASTTTATRPPPQTATPLVRFARHVCEEMLPRLQRSRAKQTFLKALLKSKQWKENRERTRPMLERIFAAAEGKVRPEAEEKYGEASLADASLTGVARIYLGLVSAQLFNYRSTTSTSSAENRWIEFEQHEQRFHNVPLARWLSAAAVAREATEKAAQRLRTAGGKLAFMTNNLKVFMKGEDLSQWQQNADERGESGDHTLW